MEKSKLIALLRTFEGSEMRELSKYLEGSSYRKTGPVFALFNYLKKLHPEFPAKKIEKELVYSKVEPKRKFGRRYFDIVSYLIGVVEDFLIQKKLTTKETTRDFLLLEVLRDRKLDKVFFQKIQSMEKAWEKERPPGLDQYHHEYLLRKEQIFHPHSAVFTQDIGTERLSKDFELYFVSNTLYSALCQASIDAVSKSDKSKLIDDQFPYLKAIFEEIDRGNYAGEARIEIYADILKSYINRDFSNYHKIYDRVKENLECFHDTEKYDLFNLLQYYCTTNYYSGKKEFLQELFELYDFSINESIALDQGYITPITFRSMVYVACAVDQTNWAAKFIVENEEFLEEKFRSDTANLCRGILEFNKKNYENSVDQIVAVKFHDPLYGLQARVLLLQCYYEIDDSEDQFMNLVRSFNAFLDRNKNLADEVVVPTKQFIKLASKLMLSRTELNVDFEKLYEEISSTQNVNAKKWLDEKATALLENKKGAR